MYILASTAVMTAYVPGVIFMLFVSFFGVWFVLRTRDATTSTTTPTIPQGLDPYEVAYLNGGVERVLHVVAMDLAERGYLRVSMEYFTFGERVWIRRASKSPSIDYLGKMEREVFEGVPIKDAPLEEILGLEHLQAHAHVRCQEIERNVVARGFVHAPQRRAQAHTFKLIMSGLMVLLTAFTLFHDPEHPGLVLGVCALGLAGVFWGVRVGWLTDLGKRYISVLHQGHQHLRRTASTYAEIHAQYNTLIGALYHVRETLNPAHREHVEDGPAKTR